MVFEWKRGSHHKASAQVAGEVCKELERTESGLTAQTLLDASRPEEAPLHGEFEWDDSVAAEEFRKSQARQLISHIVVMREEHAVKTREFHVVCQPNYESVESIMAVPVKRESLLDRAKRDFESYRGKYSGLKELSTVFAAYDAAF